MRFPGIPWDFPELCGPREIVPGVCDIPQRSGIISLAAQTPKGGAICVNVQQLLRTQIGVMVAGHDMVHPVCFLVAQYLFTGLPFLSYPGPNSRLLGPHNYL